MQLKINFKRTIDTRLAVSLAVQNVISQLLEFATHYSLLKYRPLTLEDHMAAIEEVKVRGMVNP